MCVFGIFRNDAADARRLRDKRSQHLPRAVQIFTVRLAALRSPGIEIPRGRKRRQAHRSAIQTPADHARLFGFFPLP